MIKPKRIFITGGTGFIGKPLVKLLEKKGQKLLLLTRSPAKYRPFFDISKTELVKGDLINFKIWPQVVSKFKPDIAIHLAWEGIPDFSPAMCIKNLKYGVDLYEFLGQIGCKMIITTGSCWEYGKTIGAVNEDQPIFPTNAFVSAKDALLNLGREIAKVNGQNFIWSRLFYVYGPGQKETSLIPRLISCLKTGEKPQLNNANAAQDFIYVQDVAEAITTIIDCCQAPGHHVFNIGFGKLVSVAEIANIIYENKVLKEGSPMGFYSDISRLGKLGWKPKTSIKEGIRKTMLQKKYA